MYSIKEIFYSLQGEGAHSGRAAVFVRFTGCNLWNGLERDKASSSCPFCDTDFVGVDGQNGGKYANEKVLVEKIKSFWPKQVNDIASNIACKKSKPYIVFTGGEPLLQLDSALINESHRMGFELGVETNGSIVAPKNIDWICVSPKVGMELKISSGNELKLLYPQSGLLPENYLGLDFEHFYLQAIFLQAIDEEAAADNQQKVLAYCLANPQWKYSLQLHKILKID